MSGWRRRFGRCRRARSLRPASPRRRRPDRRTARRSSRRTALDDAPDEFARRRSPISPGARSSRSTGPRCPTPRDRGEPDRERRSATRASACGRRSSPTTSSFPVDDDGRRVAPDALGELRRAQPLRPGVDNRRKTIASFEPFADFNQPSFAAGEPANPLVAQNGAYTRYEIHFNEPEFTAFAANGWSGGLNLPDASHPARFPVGSIAVKAAWRPLTAADPPSVRARSYVERAEIVDVAKTLAAGRTSSARSATSRWSGFTSRSRPRAGRNGSGARSSMSTTCRRRARARRASRTPATPGSLMRISTRRGQSASGRRSARAGTLPVDWTNPPKPDPAPMQVVRRHPIDPSIMAANRAYWNAPGVKGTVWERYMLVAVQWPTSARPPAAGQRRRLFSRATRGRQRAGRILQVDRGAGGESDQHHDGDLSAGPRRRAAWPATRSCPTRAATISSERSRASGERRRPPGPTRLTSASCARRRPSLRRRCRAGRAHSGCRRAASSR